MKRFFEGIPKVIFALICYISALLLALLSGYFTVNFYADSQAGWNRLAMGGLAAMLEFTKLMLAITFPFIKDRDIKIEKKVMFFLKICFFLSIMASVNFFLSGGEIERSPASNITALLYTYIPMLEIIPLQFSQFIATMSLSVLVEYLIIFLPVLAPVLFLEKVKSRQEKFTANNSYEKLVEVIKYIPSNIINKLHSNIVGVEEKNDTSNITVSENTNISNSQKPKMKLLKSTNHLKIESPSSIGLEKNTVNKNGTNSLNTYNEPTAFVRGKPTGINDAYNPPIIRNDNLTPIRGKGEEESNLNPVKTITQENNNTYSFVKGKDIKTTDKEEILKAMFKFRSGDTCPSVKALSDYTGLSKTVISEIKKELEYAGIIKTMGLITNITAGYPEAIKAVKDI